MQDQYRIVTNGTFFRIQKYIPKGIFRKEKWEFTGYYITQRNRGTFRPFKIDEFPTYQDAQNHINRILKQKEIDARPWTVVNENVPPEPILHNP
jgi:hypothetical protein